MGRCPRIRSSSAGAGSDSDSGPGLGSGSGSGSGAGGVAGAGGDAGSGGPWRDASPGYSTTTCSPLPGHGITLSGRNADPVHRSVVAGGNPVFCPTGSGDGGLLESPGIAGPDEGHAGASKIRDNASSRRQWF